MHVLINVAYHVSSFFVSTSFGVCILFMRTFLRLCVHTVHAYVPTFVCVYALQFRGTYNNKAAAYNS